jgi:hypothetical protein
LSGVLQVPEFTPIAGKLLYFNVGWAERKGGSSGSDHNKDYDSGGDYDSGYLDEGGSD